MEILVNGKLFSFNEDKNGVACFTSRLENIQMKNNQVFFDIKNKNNKVSQPYPYQVSLIIIKK